MIIATVFCRVCLAEAIEPTVELTTRLSTPDTAAARLLFDADEVRAFIVATPNDPLAAWGFALPFLRAGALRRDGAMRLLSVPTAAASRPSGPPGIDISLSPGRLQGLAVAALGPLLPLWVWLYEGDDGELAAGASLDVGNSADIALSEAELGLVAAYTLTAADTRRSWFVPTAPVSAPVFVVGVSTTGRTVLHVGMPPEGEGTTNDPAQIEIEQLLELVGSTSGYGLLGVRSRLLTSVSVASERARPDGAEWPVESCIELCFGLSYIDRHFTSPLTARNRGSAGLLVELEGELSGMSLQLVCDGSYELAYRGDVSSGRYRLVPEHKATLGIEFFSILPDDAPFAGDLGLELTSPAPSEPLEYSVSPGVQLKLPWARLATNADIEWTAESAADIELSVLLEAKVGPVTVGIEPTLTWTGNNAPAGSGNGNADAEGGTTAAGPTVDTRAYLRVKDGGDSIDLVLQFDHGRPVPGVRLTYSSKHRLSEAEERSRNVEVDGQSD